MNKKSLSITTLRDILRKSSSLCKPYLQLLPPNLRPSSSIEEKSKPSQIASNKTTKKENFRKALNEIKPSWSRWKRITFIIAMPIVGICMLNTIITREKREQVPFVKYDYLRIRNKRFPWGDGEKSLFHNPKVNALPNGYEYKSEVEEKKTN